MGVRRATDPAACVRMLAPAERWSVDGDTLADCLAGAHLVEVHESGNTVCALALGLAGDVATIRAAGGAPGRAFGPGLDSLENALKVNGVRQLRLFTQRPGLVRRMRAAGYRIAGACGLGVEMTKELQ